MDTVLSIREDPVRKVHRAGISFVVFPRAQCWVPSCIPCTPHLSQTSSVNTTWTIIFMLMIAKFICLSRRVLLANRLHPNCALSHAFTMLTIGCQPISWCSITSPSSTTAPARIYSCLLRCDLLIELSKEHRCVVRHCHVYGQTNKQHMSVCFLPPAQHCSNQWTYLFPSLWNFDPRIRNIQDWPL